MSSPKSSSEEFDSVALDLSKSPVSNYNQHSPEIDILKMSDSNSMKYSTASDATASESESSSSSKEMPIGNALPGLSLDVKQSVRHYQEALNLFPSLSTYSSLDTFSMASAASSFSAMAAAGLYGDLALPAGPFGLHMGHLNRKRKRTPSQSQSTSNIKEEIDDREERLRPSSAGEEKKDDAYWDRRRKNNEAAKRSRDARRRKEEEIALRAAYLEQENLKLRAQVAILKNETTKLHYILYSRSNMPTVTSS